MDWSLIGGNSRFVGYPTDSVGYSATGTGSWVEVCSSLPFNISGFYVTLRYDFASDTGLVDIGTGGSGSEIALVSDLYVGTDSDVLSSGSRYFIPIGLAAGTRISFYSVSYSDEDCHCNIQLVPQNAFASNPFHTLTRSKTYGAVSPNTGFAVTFGADYTWGDWVMFAAGLPFTVRALSFMVRSSYSYSYIDAAVQVGIGTLGSEVPIISDWRYVVGTCNNNTNPTAYPLVPVCIPKNEFLHMRARIDYTADYNGNGIIYVYG